MTVRAKRPSRTHKTTPPHCSTAGRTLRACRYGKGGKTECSSAGRALRACNTMGLVPLNAAPSPRPSPSKTPRPRRTATTGNTRRSIAPTPRTPAAHHPTPTYATPIRRKDKGRRLTVFGQYDSFRKAYVPEHSYMPHPKVYVKVPSSVARAPRHGDDFESMVAAAYDTVAAQWNKSEAELFRRSSRPKRVAKRLITEI